ncbi:MAG: hypothetical protein MI867_19140, partial [Pseudomonadales bacterium]|nr:hypothetical protein [Pseudomonadales bacterium]
MKCSAFVCFFSLLSLLAVQTPAKASGLIALNDTQLSGVTGQEGVAMDFVYAMNAYYDDSATYTPGASITDANHLEGDPLSSLDNCDGLMNPCSLGITVNNRPGMWVMLKDMYGIQKINNFWLDGRETEDVSTVAGLADMNRFIEGEGGAAQCVLPGRTVSNCLPDTPSLPSLSMRYGPGGSDEYETFEADVEWHLFIGRVAVQYDGSIADG